jgi:predicted ATP-dependent serine protease
MENDKPEDYKIISSHEMVLRLKAQGEERPLVNVRSKLPSLDKAISNFHDGELIAVSGPTKMGKTLLCQSLTKNFAEQQHYSLWFSYEVTPRGFINGFDLEDMPLFYMPEALRARSLEWVEEKILQGLEQKNTRIVFIDHLHYLFDLVQKANISLTIGNVIRRLKTLAVTHHLIIFLLCHTTKPGGEGPELSYNSIRDSSFVSQEADSVFMIQRTGETLGEMRVEFHRRTGCFGVMIPLVKVGKYLMEEERL